MPDRKSRVHRRPRPSPCLDLRHTRPILISSSNARSGPFYEIPGTNPCHIPYLTSNISSPTPTFRTCLRTLLRRYFNSSSPDPFRCYATTIIVSLHFYFLLLSPIVPCSPIVSIPCYFRLAF